jgi:hypothetical protein
MKEKEKLFIGKILKRSSKKLNGKKHFLSGL